MGVSLVPFINLSRTQIARDSRGVDVAPILQSERTVLVENNPPEKQRVSPKQEAGHSLSMGSCGTQQPPQVSLEELKKIERLLVWRPGEMTQTVNTCFANVRT